MPFQESFLKISSNSTKQKVAIKTWSDKESDEANLTTILALHGWLDNAATFDLVAPYFKNVRLVSIDLSGHGRSFHREYGAEYYIWSYVEEVIAIADELGLTQFSLLGHSMGGAVACLVSSLYPEKVQQLALLDAVGPLPTAAKDAPAKMRRALDQKRQILSRRVRYYKTKEAAVAARVKKGISVQAATLLGARSISQNDDGYFWSSDQRLTKANLFSMTEEQVEAFLRKIECPTLLVAAADLLNKHHEFHHKRVNYINDIEIVRLDGNHHQHLDGKVEEVARLLCAFFEFEGAREGAPEVRR